jgi:hypothetical protein
MLVLAAGSAVVAALAWPQSLGVWQPRYVGGLTWVSVPFIFAAVLLSASLLAGLDTPAPGVLMYGTIAGMVIALGYGIWPYNRDYNAAWDFPALAAAVERQAAGGDVAVFGGRWFALDYYLGRRVYSAQTLAEFTEFARRPDHPVVVTNGRTWNSIRASSDVALCALDERPLGSQTMVILRASSQCAPALRTPASSATRQ